MVANGDGAAVAANRRPRAAASVRNGDDPRFEMGNPMKTCLRSNRVRIGVGLIAVGAMAALGLGTAAPRTHAENTFGGAGTTITQSTAPPKLDTPSASPLVTAAPWAGGRGNGHG